VPDVSADADPYTGYVVYWDGGWGAIGGTSAAAPLWAAYMALVNASSACAGIPVGFANPALYATAASHYATDFSDVTNGNNDSTGTSGGKFAAGTGYDMASGLGTPVGPALATDLCAYAGSAGSRVGVTNPGPQTSSVGSPTSLQIAAADSSTGNALSYAATGLPTGLTIASATGVVSGTPTATGASPVTVTATDANGASRTVSFTWTVTLRTTATAVSCSPSAIEVGATTTCTATVSDSAGGTASPPAGTVRFSASAAGTFSGAGACTLAQVSAGSASCSATYQPSSSGAVQFSGQYSGDSGHVASSGSAGLTVSAPPAPPAPSPTSSPPAPPASSPPAPTGSTSRAGGASSPGCPAPGGRAGGTTLGLIRLGLTRSQARGAYAASRDHATRNEDMFCLNPVGLKVGYASTGLLRMVPRGQRGSLSGRVVWIATANRFFAIDGIRVGATQRAAGRHLKLGRPLAIGSARWYLASAGGATVAVKVQHGVVQEIGLAARQLTATRAAQRALLSSF
jgi:hypothetical protein